MVTFSAVIFDLAGTLVDDWPEETHLENIRQMAETLSVSYEDLLPMWITELLMDVKQQLPTIEDYVAHVCYLLDQQPDRSKIQKAAQLRYTFMKDVFLTPRPDAVATLVKLREMGYQIGLISNTSVEIPLLWQETAFSQLIDPLIFSCLVGIEKPNGQIYHIASHNLKLPPSQCIFVGDGGSLELTGAKRAGMFPVLIRTSDAHTWIFDKSREDAKGWDGPEITVLSDIFGVLEEMAM